jgi:hypothetical protein
MSGERLGIYVWGVLAGVRLGAAGACECVSDELGGPCASWRRRAAGRGVPRRSAVGGRRGGFAREVLFSYLSSAP